MDKVTLGPGYARHLTNLKYSQNVSNTSGYVVDKQNKEFAYSTQVVEFSVQSCRVHVLCNAAVGHFLRSSPNLLPIYGELDLVGFHCGQYCHAVNSMVQTSVFSHETVVVSGVVIRGVSAISDKALVRALGSLNNVLEFHALLSRMGEIISFR